MSVWEVHTIHPKASPEANDTPNNPRDALTAIGYNPTPPLVAVIANYPAINATNNSDRPNSAVSGTVYLITKNMAT